MSETRSTPRPAVVLLSGGLDSATVLAIARERRFDVYAISFRYGQRHAVELDCATRLAATYGVKRHHVVDLDLAAFGGSALTDPSIDVPKCQGTGRAGAAGHSPHNVIPVTYVPARNTIFLSFALAWAEVLGSRDIFLGVNALDYSGYPDCRPEYLDAFERMANLATRAGVEATGPGERLTVHAPLLRSTKAQIVAEGLRLGVDYAMTSSCYDPDPATARACGRCDACRLRQKGFEANGVTDPVTV